MVTEPNIDNNCDMRFRPKELRSSMEKWKKIAFPSDDFLRWQWESHRLLTGLVCLVLALGIPLLWFWDSSIDTDGAVDTIGLRLCGLTNLVVAWLAIRGKYRSWGPGLLMLWFMVNLSLFIAIAALVDDGTESSGLFYLMVGGAVALQWASIWINIASTLAVLCLPVVCSEFGFLPHFEVAYYLVEGIPAAIFCLMIQFATAWGNLGRFQAESTLKKLSTTDSLTGVLNRRAFFDQLSRLIRRRNERNQTLAILYFDIDHFKRINDTFGHAAGDSVIQHLAKTGSSICRDGDILARIGGEEFVIAALVSEADKARLLAERLRSTVEGSAMTVGTNTIHYTVSVGVAVASATDPEENALLEAADSALYTAKANGRNRVEIVV